MPGHLEWYTTAICPDGKQRVPIRSRDSSAQIEPIFLNKEQSQLLMTTLTSIANDTTIPWPEARQAVLRAFAETLASSR
jgi:hypothetical protein